MEKQRLVEMLEDFVKNPSETEWIEFKHNFHSFEEIGKNISALSNGANLHNKEFGYIAFGVKDGTHEIVGTTFKAKIKKKGNENFEHWLINRLDPQIDFRIEEFDYKTGVHISLFIIPAAQSRPTRFAGVDYIRVGSITRELRYFPEKEKKIWQQVNQPFEKEIALGNISAGEVIQLLSIETYFDLINMPYPTNQDDVIDKIYSEGFITKNRGRYSITKLGAILFAKNLPDFESVYRKAMRVIVYKGNNKTETEREQIDTKGYAVGFVGLIEFINGQLPANEEIGKAIRRDVRIYPEIAIRELVANALIHQDYTEKGFPMVEIYSDRIEISNPGKPLIDPNRFIDGYQSRNDKLADIMRRLGFCEEKGSGMVKVVLNNELFQLPPIYTSINESRTTIIMYSYRILKKLDKNEKILACYQHSCLKQVSNEKMTNKSLRERFNIDDKNYATASRIIRDTIDAKMIKDNDPTNTSKRFAKYIPFWA